MSVSTFEITSQYHLAQLCESTTVLNYCLSLDQNHRWSILKLIVSVGPQMATANDTKLAVLIITIKADIKDLVLSSSRTSPRMQVPHARGYAVDRRTCPSTEVALLLSREGSPDKLLRLEDAGWLYARNPKFSVLRKSNVGQSIRGAFSTNCPAQHTAYSIQHTDTACTPVAVAE